MGYDYELLINEVRKYPWLYMTKSVEFRNSIKRENSWTQIGLATGLTVSSAKQKWKYLRDTYCRELNKLKQPSGSAPGVGSKWPFFHLCSFLRDHIQTKQTISNVTLVSDEPENFQEFSLSQAVPEVTLSVDGVTENSDTTGLEIGDGLIQSQQSQLLEDQQVDPEYVSSPTTLKSSSSSSSSGRKTRKRTTTDIEEEILMTIKNQNENFDKTIAERDTEYYFCMSLMTRLRKLSSKRRRTVRHKIENIIFDAEEEEDQ